MYMLSIAAEERQRYNMNILLFVKNLTILTKPLD